MQVHEKNIMKLCIFYGPKDWAQRKCIKKCLKCTEKSVCQEKPCIIGSRNSIMDESPVRSLFPRRRSLCQGSNPLAAGARRNLLWCRPFMNLWIDRMSVWMHRGIMFNFFFKFRLAFSVVFFLVRFATYLLTYLAKCSEQRTSTTYKKCIMTYIINIEARQSIQWWILWYDSILLIINKLYILLCIQTELSGKKRLKLWNKSMYIITIIKK